MKPGFEVFEKKIRGVLKSIKLENGFPQINALWDLEKHVPPSFQQYLTGVQLMGLVGRKINQLVFSRIEPEKVREFSGALSTVVPVDELEAASREIAQHVYDLPITYEIGFNFSNLEVDDLVSVGNGNINISSYRKSFAGGLLQAPEKHGLLISVKELGFADLGLDSYSNQNAVDSIKIYINHWLISGMLCLDSLILLHQGGVFNWGKRIVETFTVTAVDKVRGHSFGLLLPSQISQALNGVRYGKKLAGLSDSSEIIRFLINDAEIVTKLIVDKSDEASYIKSAAVWCFNSRFEENETLAFLQVCFGLEALFGDGESVGLTKGLASRCAMVVSDRLSARAGVRTAFEKMYQLRSKIVHGKVARLKPDERAQLHWARHILVIGIQKELEKL